MAIFCPTCENPFTGSPRYCSNCGALFFGDEGETSSQVRSGVLIVYAFSDAKRYKTALSAVENRKWRPEIVTGNDAKIVTVITTPEELFDVQIGWESHHILITDFDRNPLDVEKWARSNGGPYRPVSPKSVKAIGYLTPWHREQAIKTSNFSNGKNMGVAESLRGILQICDRNSFPAPLCLVWLNQDDEYVKLDQVKWSWGFRKRL